jgi:hypothetical protein
LKIEGALADSTTKILIAVSNRDTIFLAMSAAALKSTKW